MKIYLVGGAVRDQLLGYTVRERDWVVVGATPADMLRLGYQQVGRDFPVFLHPKTREEYALARTERKQGRGYYGFSCDFSPHVTLVEDLARRDLTINAIAMDDTGKIIDPYHGQADLKAKLLRHVTEAFVEDPVRVLRTARFAARYYHLGFTVEQSTRRLMYRMACAGELSHLVAERVWQEWHTSLQERHPEVFMQTLRACGALQEIFPEIQALFGVPNSRRYHLEVDSGVHTMMVVQSAVRLSGDPMIRFAAWVHDLGKAVTPIQQWPKHINHEALGVDVIESLCQRLRIPTDYRRFAQLVSQTHLNIHKIEELKAVTIAKILEQCDAFRQPERFRQLLTVCEADRRGCIGAGEEDKLTEQWWEIFRRCQQIKADILIQQGKRGEEIRQGLHQLRVATIKQWKEESEHEK